MAPPSEPLPRDATDVKAEERRRKLRELIFGTAGYRRFTQDSPVMPDVWLLYGENPTEAHDLLLTPHADASAAKLGQALREAVDRRGAGADRVAYNEAYVAATLDLAELLQLALPLTKWWSDYVWRGHDQPSPGRLDDPSVRNELRRRCELPVGSELPDDAISPDLVWLVRLVGSIAVGTDEAPLDAAVEAAARLLHGADPPPPDRSWLLWRVSQNREATTTIAKSLLAVKADAATRLFDLDCRNLRWAVIDSGIDATHPAFRRRDTETEALRPEPFELVDGTWVNNTRIVATYDFSRLRAFLKPLSGDAPQPEHLTDAEWLRVTDFRNALSYGRAIDWDALELLLRVSHDDTYTGSAIPRDEHGTHVAGILTADWREKDGSPEKASLRGIANGLELYDLRVFDENGRSNEFVVIAALQFVRHLNAHRDSVAVHGVNCSFSIKHDVENYACGRTPVCEEAERLVGAGTVVVAAAGNDGFARYQTTGGSTDGYRSISIVDPGNAERVITVGATHRYKPHMFGVSYFSSRGPTGDGRVKPDIVAPGEKIVSPIPRGRAKGMDGTSMAAPHVSAAAALLMARYDELIGKPEEIKRLLCESATDLGRERYFQGSGMLDILRALQSV